MTDNRLHIFNTECDAEIFKKSELKGATLFLNEQFCKGPLIKDIGSDSFWKLRYGFFEKEFRIEKLTYFDKTIKNFTKFEDLSSYKEVVLWFEPDLLSQINLIALCTFLLKFYVKKTNYFLVCTGFEKENGKMQKLTDFSSKEYKYLYNHKVSLSKSNLQFAKQCWELYVENNADELQNFNFDKSLKFNYLQAAIYQHLK